MGMFSWFTQDTNHRIVNGEPYRVIMTDNNGNQYVEDCYEGYGVFGGKDYYELLAEMNGYSQIHCKKGEELRDIGIRLAFENNPYGTNPNVIHPSLSESGEYFNGIAPNSDPDQGFTIDEDEEWDDWDDEEDECDE